MSAQEYRPMLKVGKQWREYWSDGTAEEYFDHKIDGDTTIAGEKFFTVHTVWIDPWFADTIFNERISDMLCETDGRVWHVDKNGVRNLLYDFNLATNSKVQIDPNTTLEVVATDTIHVLGNDYKRMEVMKRGNTTDTYTEYWVEGIGGSHTLFQFGNDALILACFDNGRCIFTGKNFEGMPALNTSPDGYRPLLREGREWSYRNIGASREASDFRLFVSGDTVIAGETWKKIYREELSGSAPVYEKAMRETGRRIFQLKPGATGQELLIDFTLEPGERYTPAGADGRYLEVLSTDTVLVDGQAHRRLVLWQHVNGTATYLTCWTEGIGSDYGIDIPTLWSDQGPRFLGMGITQYPYQLASCTDRERTTPVGMTNLRQSDFSEPESGAIYNFYGHRLPKAPRKGIYIINGKKVRIH